MANDTYEVVIGMEIHAELRTASKMFCGCPVVDTTVAEPNTAVCPVCTGLPGAMPVVNKRAVEQAMMVGLALNCRINEFTSFARKNYFYPDLPKGYQISQYDHPIATDGWLEIRTDDGETVRVGITRAHHGGGHGQELPPRSRWVHADRLQPVECAAARDRLRARHAFGCCGSHLCDEDPRDPSLPRRQHG